MKLSSPAFAEGGSIPMKYTCEGENINPPLEIEGVPAKAGSLVLIMDDPDVPPSVRADQMYDHWVIFDIPPTIRMIEENSPSPGVMGKSTNGQNTYVGPCPPDREHRYFFKLYALDREIRLRTGATKQEVERAMQGHILAEAKLMGRYRKQNT